MDRTAPVQILQLGKKVGRFEISVRRNMSRSAHLRTNLSADQKIIGETLEFIVDGECITTPVVREQLGIRHSIAISETSYDDAVALADRLRARWGEIGPKLV